MSKGNAAGSDLAKGMLRAAIWQENAAGSDLAKGMLEEAILQRGF